MNNLFFEYVNSFVENIHKIRQHWATRIDHSSIIPLHNKTCLTLKQIKTTSFSSKVYF